MHRNQLQSVMPKRIKRPNKGAVYWPQNTPHDVHRPAMESFVSKLLVLLVPTERQGLSEEIRSEYESACNWFFESLYQAHFSVPPAPMALPKSKALYGRSSNFGMPYGFALTTKVLDAALRCGFVSVEPGQFVPGGRGKITRVRAIGRLLAQFVQVGFQWHHYPPPKASELILLNEGGRGSYRRIATTRDSPQVALMQSELAKINQFLSKQCIWIDLPNRALQRDVKGKASWQSNVVGEADEFTDSEGLTGAAISVAQIYLRRIFTQNCLQKGGRFYGAWWQIVPSNLRRRIMINDDRTIEVDYSGLALNMLYAKEGVALVGDPYDIGLAYTGKDDPRRSLVKRYLNAVLNDSSGKYRLTAQELGCLALTHHQLHRLVVEKHDAVKDYFNSGIGVTLQYFDSQLAEQVMLNLNRQKIACLPIHDSFIVPVHAAGRLEAAMKSSFQAMFGVDIDLKNTCGFNGLGINAPRGALTSSVQDVQSFIAAYLRHQEDYTYMSTYLESWRSANFSPQEIDWQCDQINFEHAILKDLGLPSRFDHQFRGAYPLMRQHR